MTREIHCPLCYRQRIQSRVAESEEIIAPKREETVFLVFGLVFLGAPRPWCSLCFLSCHSSAPDGIIEINNADDEFSENIRSLTSSEFLFRTRWLHNWILNFLS